MTWSLACLCVAGHILSGMCPPRHARLLPQPLPRILAAGRRWRAMTVELDATEVIAAALVAAFYLDETDLSAAIAFLQQDKAEQVLLRHHERVSQAALRSAAQAVKEMGL